MIITKVRQLTLIVLRRKEVQNWLLRSKPWLTAIPAISQVHTQGHGNVSVCYQTGSAWRLSLLSFKMRKGQFFTDRAEEELRPCKDFEETQANPPTADKKNVSLDQMVNSQINCCLALSPKDALILMKTKHHSPEEVIYIYIYIYIMSCR